MRDVNHGWCAFLWDEHKDGSNRHASAIIAYRTLLNHLCAVMAFAISVIYSAKRSGKTGHWLHWIVMAMCVTYWQADLSVGLLCADRFPVIRLIAVLSDRPLWADRFLVLRLQDRALIALNIQDNVTLKQPRHASCRKEQDARRGTLFVADLYPVRLATQMSCWLKNKRQSTWQLRNQLFIPQSVIVTAVTRKVIALLFRGQAEKLLQLLCWISAGFNRSDVRQPRSRQVDIDNQQDGLRNVNIPRTRK